MPFKSFRRLYLSSRKLPPPWCVGIKCVLCQRRQDLFWHKCGFCESQSFKGPTTRSQGGTLHTNHRSWVRRNEWNFVETGVWKQGILVKGENTVDKARSQFVGWKGENKYFRTSSIWSSRGKWLEAVFPPPSPKRKKQAAAGSLPPWVLLEITSSAGLNNQCTL